MWDTQPRFLFEYERVVRAWACASVLGFESLDALSFLLVLIWFPLMIMLIVCSVALADRWWLFCSLALFVRVLV